MLGVFNFVREMGVDWMEVHSYTREVVFGRMLKVLAEFANGSWGLVPNIM